MSSVICKNPSYSGPSYPSSPVVIQYVAFEDVLSIFLLKNVPESRLIIDGGGAN